MNKTIEKPFLALFGGLTSPAAHCLEWMDETYDLGVYPAKQPREPLPPKWRDYFDNVLPQTIKTRVEAFDETVVMCGNPSPLMEEIENNLNEQPTQEAKERYLFSLLIPFKELADKYTPVALIAQEERQIQETEKDLAYWKQQPQDMELTNTAGKPSGTVKGQVEACCSMISRHRQQIERYKHISDQYRILTGCCEDGARWMQKDTVEAYLHTLHSIAFHFAIRLDALLLTYGIDLLRLERESGVYLKERRQITDVDYYIGSRELAQKYIDALPKTGGGQPQPEAPEPPKQKGRTSKPFNTVIITQPKENTLDLLHNLIDGKHGKGAIIFLFVAIRYGLITRPTSTQVLKEFGNIGNKSLIQKYLCLEYPLYTDDEINGAKRALGIATEG